MTIFRLIMIVASALTIGGASYLSYNGIGSESSDLDRSIRVGSGGNTFSTAAKRTSSPLPIRTFPCARSSAKRISVLAAEVLP